MLQLLGVSTSGITLSSCCSKSSRNFTFVTGGLEDLHFCSLHRTLSDCSVKQSFEFCSNTYIKLTWEDGRELHLNCKTGEVTMKNTIQLYQLVQLDQCTVKSFHFCGIYSCYNSVAGSFLRLGKSQSC